MIGDILADLRALAEASSSYQQTGSIGDWLRTTLAEFRGLPAALTTLQDQVSRVNAVFTANNAQASEAAQALREASVLIDAARTAYPAASLDVDQVTAAIAPVLPKLYAGTYDNQVLGVLASNGGALASTTHEVTDLISKRDQAQALLQSAVSSPSVSATTRNDALTALASVGTTEWLKIGVGLLIGFVIIRSVMKR